MVQVLTGGAIDERKEAKLAAVESVHAEQKQEKASAVRAPAPDARRGGGGGGGGEGRAKESLFPATAALTRGMCLRGVVFTGFLEL